MKKKLAKDSAIRGKNYINSKWNGSAIHYKDKII